MSKMLTVRVDDNLANRLEALAEKTKRGKSFYFKEMLIQYLDEVEENYLALERLNKKNAKYLSTDELRSELGL